MLPQVKLMESGGREEKSSSRSHYRQQKESLSKDFIQSISTDTVNWTEPMLLLNLTNKEEC